MKTLFQLLKLTLQPANDFLFQARNIRLRDTEQVRNLLLGRTRMRFTLVDYALELLLGAGFVHSLLISLLEDLIAEGEDAIADVPTLILVHALVHEVGEPALQVAIDGNVVDESICTLV